VSVAQQQPAADLHEVSSLNEVLVHLQANLEDYRATIPNFFCDEHVVSRMRKYDVAELKTVTDSIFRLQRTLPGETGKPPLLAETRELKSVNKVPVRKDSFPQTSPVVLEGVFSNGERVVSLEMARCFNYTLRRSSNISGHPAIEIAFAFKLDRIGDKTCPGPEKSSGRAFFDAISFHALRVEMTVPNYEISPQSQQFALWRWRIDYTPVTFDGRDFWLPKEITSRADGDDKLTVWYFEAEYSNYHKLIVTSHIVTDVGDNPPPPPQ
jgi:hypothetical protein